MRQISAISINNELRGVLVSYFLMSQVALINVRGFLNVTYIYEAAVDSPLFRPPVQRLDFTIADSSINLFCPSRKVQQTISELHLKNVSNISQFSKPSEPISAAFP